MNKTVLLACTILLVGFSQTVHAQDVTWRNNYAAARKEASETGKPLLMDFGTEACTWCRKLEATTFRDPRIVKLLNDRFIPVKIDANREMRLTQALQIDSYPTVILASAEGHVLGRHVGYADCAEMNALLAKAPQKQEASKEHPPAGNALFAQARADYDAKRYAECLRQCNLIMAALPSSTEAQEARLLAQQIALDPVASRLVKDQINAGLSTLQPRLAAALDR